MKRLLGIAALALISIGGWRLGASLSSDGFTLAMGVIYGSLIGVPAAMIAATARKTVQHEHVHRWELKQPVHTPVSATEAITQRPQRLIVVDERQRLAASIEKRIEVRG